MSFLFLVFFGFNRFPFLLVVLAGLFEDDEGFDDVAIWRFVTVVVVVAVGIVVGIAVVVVVVVVVV